jgi:hypothetical protein
MPVTIIAALAMSHLPNGLRRWTVAYRLCGIAFGMTVDGEDRAAARKIAADQLRLHGFGVA